MMRLFLLPFVLFVLPTSANAECNGAYIQNAELQIATQYDGYIKQVNDDAERQIAALSQSPDAKPGLLETLSGGMLSQSNPTRDKIREIERYRDRTISQLYEARSRAYDQVRAACR